MSGAKTTEKPPTLAASMYLAGLTLRRFRSCRDVRIKFQPGLTLIVGENNSGKSNVINGIRLLTSPLSGRRTSWFELDDVSFGENGPIELIAEFDGLTKFQRGQYIGALDVNTGRAWYTTRYRPDDSAPRRSRIENLAGPLAGPDGEPENREQITHVYLAPLRDAQRELDSATGNRISLIIKYLTNEAEREAFLKLANDGLRNLEGHPVITDTKEKLQQHVADLTDPVRGQAVGLSFQDLKLHRLTRGLRLKMAEHGVDLADIAESGLGYANLLYMASVILELRNAEDSELTLFLVEEPEAHLHPQLQAVLLDYLRDQAAQSIRDDSGGPAGRIQVIATTHSPNLASAVGIENVVVLRTVEHEAPVEKRDASSERDGKESRHSTQRETAAIALSDIDLTKDERRKINQYLDVSRAELLFTRRAILVEGVSEAVLLPALARKCVFEATGDDYTANILKFRAVSIINIGSVDFVPYIKLLLQSVDGVRLVDRLVVITDGDPELDDFEEENTEDEADEATESEDSEGGAALALNRPERLNELGVVLAASDILVVCAADYTLEADLMAPFEVNGPLLELAFKRQKPRSGRFWTVLEGSNAPAEEFYRKLRKSKGRYIGKGEFAHDVASLIRDGHGFKCPSYLRAAIEKALD